MNNVYHASKTVAANSKLQYLNSLLRVEVMWQIYCLCEQVVSTPMAHINQIILVWGDYFPSVNVLSN